MLSLGAGKKRSMVIHFRPGTLILALVVWGCAPVPALDDAELVSVTVASPDDLARYSQAKSIFYRETFGGASFSDGKGQILVSFSAGEYDAYLAYLVEHPDQLPNQVNRANWPTLRMAFRSRHVLFDPGATTTSGSFFFCEQDRLGARIYGFGPGDILWRGRFVAARVAEEIEAAARTDTQLQNYEVFFDYVYWDTDQPRRSGEAVMLLPLPADVCFAIERPRYPFPAAFGRPLRITKDMINQAVGTLPRPIELPSGNTP